MLKLAKVSISYPGKIILQELDLTASKGEIVGVVAPNGTGKTTLFHIIANYTKPDAGSVVINGKYTYRNEKEEVKIHKQLLSFPEQSDLFEQLTGIEHLKLYAKIWKGTDRHVPKVIERLQMVHYVKRKVKTYSLGMRQRLCFAMMMAADTPIMLMDEVMNGLDITNIALLSDCLAEMKAEGKLIFIASHLLENLDLYADRVLFLKDGKIVQQLNHTNEKDFYLKVELTPIEYEQLQYTQLFPEDHLYIANHLVCIPLTGQSLSEQIGWIEKFLDLKKELSIGPLGTVEYYEKNYAAVE